MNTMLATEMTLDARLAQRQRPVGRAIMYQSWRELLFAHWRVEPELVQSRLPRGLHVDTFEGQAWIGLVPFLMRRIRPWWSPAIPGVSDFREVNLRTYVIDETGVPGVWFLSLDANTRFGVWWGRTFFRLPYHYALMNHSRDAESGRVEYQSRRPMSPPHQNSHFTYEPVGDARTAEPGTLDFFLTERYVLFTVAAEGRVCRGRIAHPPYEIHEARAEVSDALFELNDLPRPQRPADHLLISRGVDVEVFPLS